MSNENEETPLEYILNRNVVGEAERLYKAGVRSHTLSEPVSASLASQFVSGLRNDMSIFPVANLNDESYQQIERQYPEALRLALEIKEGLLK